MAGVAGIQITKTANGNIKSVTFDFKKYHEKITPILKEAGAIEENEFEKDLKNCLTSEQARKQTHDFIKSFPWKSNS